MLGRKKGETHLIESRETGRSLLTHPEGACLAGFGRSGRRALRQRLLDKICDCGIASRSQGAAREEVGWEDPRRRKQVRGLSAPAHAHAGPLVGATYRR